MLRIGVLLLAALLPLAYCSDVIRFGDPNVESLDDCVFDVGGRKFDLSGLKLQSTDYTGAERNYKYYMNMCAPSSKCKEASPKSSLCQFDSNSGYFESSLGNWDGGQPVAAPLDASDPKKGLLLSYTNGDRCWTPSDPMKERTANVYLTCSSTTDNTIVVSEPDTCNFKIEFKGKCSGGGGGSGGKKKGLSNGWIFIIILVVATFVYVTAGCVFNVKKKGLSGKEAFPNYSFWAAFPGYVKDGCKITANFIKNKGRRSGGQTYDEL